MFNVPRRTRLVVPNVLMMGACCGAIGSAARGAEEYSLRVQVDLSTYVNVISPEPVSAQDAPPGSNLQYAVSANRGLVEAWHRFSACCGSHSYAVAQCQFDDVVFSAPGGEPGMATISLNLLVDAAYTASPPCSAGASMQVWLMVGPGSGWIGTWGPGGTACSQVQGNGIFANEVGTTLSGMFTGPQYNVPLNTPLTFQLMVRDYIGSAGNNLGILDAAVSLPSAGNVFNIISGPAGTTVNSAQGNIVNNEWGGIPVPCPADVTGDNVVNVSDLLAVINAWGACGTPCPADITGDNQVNVSDLLAVINGWGPCP